MRRSLRDLGLDAVPFRHPLEYPGRPAPEPCLLLEAELLPLRAVPGRPLGAWPVVGGEGTWPVVGAEGTHTDGGAEGTHTDGGTEGTHTDGGGGPSSDGPGGPELDALLTALGRLVTGHRHPVLAVGSNASPAQMGHKLAAHGLPAAVPMVPVTVRGIGVGCSAHIGRAGYVAAAPYADPAAERRLVVSWLDPAQLAAVDASELHYRRVLLPATAFPMTLPSGDRLGGAYLYVSRHGVLLDPATGRPHPGAEDQGALLAALLRSSKRLRNLLGPDPRAWTERARAEEAVRLEGARIFGEEGWIRPEGELPSSAGPPDLRHADLMP
ncbi:hypothetical protein [Streptomyces huiliensis]|uniref:hypothetical protein n=1 Tax=Streptomyces huiliensis TaxID=2876027 RepID=UPI001CBF5FD1|nr:hypothetical protein [Streptomyces huiliensis]MBZ4320718.1 hypothetical protein [Streptomyces huiliensis]